MRAKIPPHNIMNYTIGLILLIFNIYFFCGWSFNTSFSYIHFFSQSTSFFAEGLSQEFPIRGSACNSEWKSWRWIEC